MYNRKVILILRTVMLLCVLGLNVFADGSGNISFGNGRQALQIVAGFILFVAAVLCLWKLVMAFLDFRGQDFGHGMQNLLMAIIGGVIVGLSVVWINSLTGQNIQPVSGF